MRAPFYTVAEVAQREGISMRRVRVLCETDRIGAHWTSSGWIIPYNYHYVRKMAGRPRKQLYQSPFKPQQNKKAP